MTPTPSGVMPQLVTSLAKVAKRHRVARKLVVAPNVAAGRELLRGLARSSGGWIGFEVSTPRPLALRLARTAMEGSGLSALDAFEEQAMLDRALDAALAAESGRFGPLSEGVGFRRRVHEAVAAMRLAGVGPEDLDRARLADWEKRRFLLRLLQRYERLLVERGRADTAKIFSLGVAALEEAGGVPAALDADVVLLMPGLGTRGLAGSLISGLCARGAKVLETDPVLGLEQPESVLWNRRREASPGSRLFAPDPETAEGAGERVDGQAPATLELDFFRAASINDELREVLRRVAARGLRWDQVEIVAPDPAAYGSALHALSARLGIPVTYAVGLPIERTRTGRVVRAYLDWIAEGFQSGPIRRLLEAGDLRPSSSRDASPPSALARRFRSLRIGWGRQRYRTQIKDALARAERLEPRRREPEEAFARRRERMRRELRELRRILFPALKATPAVPDRLGVGGQAVSPAELARGLQAFLKRVPKGVGPDRSARDDVGRILERIEATLRRRTDFSAAVAILRRHLEIRVRAARPGDDPDDRGAPWSSEGGALHLADVDHGGYTGREAVFLVGLDADRVPGPGGQDPVLLDADRRVLGGGLPTSTELMQERLHRFAALVARLRGSLTVSYTSWNPSEARPSGPSPVLLQAFRLSRRDGSLTFEDLDDALGRVVSSIPAGDRPPLDGEDVWMTALEHEGVLRTGVDAVRAAFPHLNRGLTAHEARVVGMASEVHGVITARPDLLDPRRSPSVVMSASRLQSLGSCPLRYLQASVLRAYPPDDPELDPDRWLDPLRRGGLLHAVYESSLRQAKEQGVDLPDPRFEAMALELLYEGIERMRAEVPVPGEGTLRRERSVLEDDVRSFVRMVRQQGAPWRDLELTFGIGDDDPIELRVGNGPVRVRGAIDRVDQYLEGLRVIDYKTGRVKDKEYAEGSGSFNGGRRLQHALYARVAEERIGLEVVAGEYHYPTRRGENQAFVFDRARLVSLEGLLAHMLDGVSAGTFVPTDDERDCTYCDYAAVCRVRRSEWSVSSPMAEWSKERMNAGVDPALHHLKRVRTFEG